MIVGGIIPEADARALRELGVAAVFTPKDFGLTAMMGQIVHVIRASRGLDQKKRNSAAGWLTGGGGGG